MITVRPMTLFASRSRGCISLLVHSASQRYVNYCKKHDLYIVFQLLVEFNGLKSGKLEFSTKLLHCGAASAKTEVSRWKTVQTLIWFILRPCQYDEGYIDGRSQIKVHTDERTQDRSARSWRSPIQVLTEVDVALTSLNVPLSYI